jgi:transglutaminase-like putative cysteine protease
MLNDCAQDKVDVSWRSIRCNHCDMAAHESPYRQVATDPELTELRLRAEASLRSSDDERLLALSTDLRADTEVWPHLWAPGCAIAAARLGRADARALLEEAIAAGFCQPETFGNKLAECFSGEPDWSEVQARIAANVAPPALELLTWPDPPAHAPIELERIAADRKDRLSDLLPPPQSSAWETAMALLTWVTRRWEHANDHVDWTDALHVLERVAAGERFACVEYSIVLTQALNAVGIPARRVFLYGRDHHVGLGRSHVVSEAWIDDLGSWVVLDGQNGAYWATADGDPLGLPQLRQALLDGGPCPRMVGLLTSHDDAAAEAWWKYFASGWTTGVAWGDGQRLVPIVQQVRLMKPERVVRDVTVAYPRLHDVAIGLTGTAEQPALRFTTPHPYALGFRLLQTGTAHDATDAEWRLSTAPGEHTADIQIVTPYGAYHAGQVSYRVT